ncbi:conserved hypothetical protein [Capnocytophaga canimorsus]|uniref:Uncharacterized protein n=2 Tax=Capnocytophaga canimorsus TaxID=28188 RepID=A0A0B7IRC9_9FLAO|nr:conserved hypothetical protein [Capnocytophaga canimorsus]
MVYLVMGAFAVMTLTQCTKDGAVDTINALTLPKVMVTYQQKGAEITINKCVFEQDKKDQTWIDLNGNLKKDEPTEEIASGKKYVNSDSSELSILFGYIQTLTMKEQSIVGVAITNRYIKEVDFSGNKMGLLEIMNAQKLEKIVCTGTDLDLIPLKIKLPEKEEAIESLHTLDCRGYKLIEIDQIVKKLPNRNSKGHGTVLHSGYALSEGLSEEKLQSLLTEKNWLLVDGRWVVPVGE